MINPNEEIFMPMHGFPDYLISQFGRVKSVERLVRYVHAITGKEHYRLKSSVFMKIYLNKNTGYKFIQPRINGVPLNRSIHRLVALTFIDNPKNLDYVNHKDGNKHNNCIDNLEWCTNEYNHEHATKTGLKASGSKIGSSILSGHSASAIKRMLKDGLTHSKIAYYFNVSRATVSLINGNKTWKGIKP